MLYAGPGSLVTGPVALMHHGIRSRPDLDVIDLLVPAGRLRRDTGFARLHRTGAAGIIVLHFSLRALRRGHPPIRSPPHATPCREECLRCYNHKFHLNPRGTAAGAGWPSALD